MYKRQLLTFTSPGLAIFTYFEEENETDNTESMPSLHAQNISHNTTALSAMASPQTDSSMPLVPSYYKEGRKTSTAVEGPENRWEDYDECESLWGPELSWVEEEEYYEDLFGTLLHNDTGDVFIKEEEGAILRHDLDELHQDLMQLMKKHCMVGEAFDDKYELRMPVTKPVRAEWGYPTNLSTFNTFPCFPSNSFIIALINPGYKDTVPSTIMNLFPIPSSSKVISTKHPDTTERPGNPPHWPPDSLDQSPLTFTALTEVTKISPLL